MFEGVIIFVEVGLAVKCFKFKNSILLRSLSVESNEGVGVNFPDFFVFGFEIPDEEIGFADGGVNFLFIEITNLGGIFFGLALFDVEGVGFFEAVQAYLGEDLLFFALIVQNR